MASHRLDNPTPFTVHRGRPGAPVACNCEHVNHFDSVLTTWGDTPIHRYMAVPAGNRRAQHVGVVCATCAQTCMSDYLLPEEK